jgi:pimeloyl-ACP methyl ester carboxylesterase
VRGPRTRDAETGWRSCADIIVPTLLIRGDESEILAADVARNTIEAIPATHFALVEHSGHPVPLDTPDGFLASARPFPTG